MSEPPEELIELKAHQIWEKRQLDGREGTPQSDWKEAKQYLEKNRWEVRQWKFFRRITLWWEATLLENCLESIEFLLQKLAFFTILGKLGELALIVAVVSFVFGENVRRNNEVFAAWTTITTAHKQSGSGGRIRALEFLNSRPLRFPWIWGTIDLFWDGKECKRKLVLGRRWKREPLAGLSAPKAYLAKINLCEANLREANLQHAELSRANLQHAELREANLQHADLSGANLQGADLMGTEKLTPKQIKSACFWDKAIYKGEWNEEKLSFVAKEPDNTNYIKNLKKDTASNPEQTPFCLHREN